MYICIAKILYIHFRILSPSGDSRYYSRIKAYRKKTYDVLIGLYLTFCLLFLFYNILNPLNRFKRKLEKLKTNSVKNMIYYLIVTI